jgi:hypothetical protein
MRLLEICGLLAIFTGSIAFIVFALIVGGGGSKRKPEKFTPKELERLERFRAEGPGAPKF